MEQWSRRIFYNTNCFVINTRNIKGADMIRAPFLHLAFSVLVIFVEYHLTLVMRKPAFCICEADQRLCFRYIDSTIPLLSKSEISSLCDCTARFMSDQVRNREDRFSHNEAHLHPQKATINPQKRIVRDLQ